MDPTVTWVPFRVLITPDRAIRFDDGPASEVCPSGGDVGLARDDIEDETPLVSIPDDRGPAPWPGERRCGGDPEECVDGDDAACWRPGDRVGFVSKKLRGDIMGLGIPLEEAPAEDMACSDVA